MFLHLVAAYGLCFALMNDKIPLVPWLRSAPDVLEPNFWDQMLACAFCTGFHAGWLVGFVHLAAQGTLVTWIGPPMLLVWGFAGSGFCYAIDTAVQWLETTARRE